MNKKIKIIGALMGTITLFALLLSVDFGTLNEETWVSSTTLNQEISIDPRKMVTMNVLAPYKTMDVFLSNEQTPGFKFTTVGGAWEEIAPQGTNIEAQVRFKENNQWTSWLDLEEETDLLNEGMKYATASTNPTDSMQYKFLLYGDGIHSPIIRQPNWTFIKTGDLAIGGEPQPRYASFTQMALSNGPKNIISRSAWGADESYRYMTSNDVDPVLVEVDSEYMQKFRNELTYSKVIAKDSSGNNYKWPLQYPQKVKKFIVHHTATTKNLSNPKQAIKDIYYYHAVKRGWGDIGYNYIIDKEGKIYEGRFGGEGVIGAHTGPGNNGSIGIAVLGNFEQSPVPQKAVSALSSLIGEKAALHKITPDKKSYFRGENTNNVIGHKDMMHTTCPGIYLYEKLPIIRTLAANYIKNVKPKYVKDYDYDDLSAINFIELKPASTTEFTLTLENTGKVTWNDKTYLIIDTNPELKKLVSFPSSREHVLARIDQKTVSPGSKATFKFSIKSGKKPELVDMKIAPMINGFAKLREYITIPVSVQQTDFRYKYVSSNYPGKSIKPGEVFNAWVKLQNTGNVTWRQSGENTVRIGTDHERDRKSVFRSPPSTRIGYLEEREVKPGDIGTFKMQLTAPTKPGYYQEYFTPVVEGVTWMTDGLNFATTVAGGESYEAQRITKFGLKQWFTGQSYEVEMKLRNTGQSIWKNSNTKIDFVNYSDLTIYGAKLEESQVLPGEIGTITFNAKPSTNAKLRYGTLLIKPKVDGQYLLKIPVRMRYKVRGKVEASTVSTTKTTTTKSETTYIQKDGENIRVKLSFEGSPKITASTSYKVYSGTKVIAEVGANQLTEVAFRNSKYEVKTPALTHNGTSEIRIVPNSNGIAKISNYENRPAWNTSQNDNEYRGVLEVRSEGGGLIVINELPLESYLKGLGEVSDYEEYEKIKAIMVAARSYAKYYMTQDEKFANRPYNLDDDPNVSQKYIGYGLEKRAPNVSKAVDATKGEVVTYNNTVVKTPYFSQSNGTRTKSAQAVWGWNNTPYLVSVSDSYCDANAFLGHGVGLSGCGAKGMAKAGKTYKEILSHYYPGTTLQK